MPFAYADDDDSSMLAPRLDFTPGGTSRGEGPEADIQSPFAEPERKTVPELMSPVRRRADAPGKASPVMPGAPFEALPRASDDASGLVLSFEDRFEPSPPPDADLDADPDAEDEGPFERPLSPSEPVRARPEWSRVMDSTTGRSSIGSGREIPPDPGMMPRPEAPSFGAGALDVAPHGEPAPARLRVAAGAIAGAGSALLGGAGAGWAAYSRLCLTIQTGLSQLAARGLARGLALTRRAARELGRLGHIGLRKAARWSASAAVLLGKAAKAAAQAAAIHGRALAKAALSAAITGLTWLSAAARRAFAFAAGAVASRLAARARASGGDAGTAEPSAATSAEGAGVPAFSQAASLAAPGSAASPDRGAGQAGETQPGNGVLSWWRSIPLPQLPAWTWTYAGLAAASIAVLLVAFGPNPATTPASAALTFPIPDKPAPSSVDQSAAPAGGRAAVRSLLPGPFAFDDPIDEMVAYVAARREAGGFAETASVLAAAGDIEGLEQFVRAAEIVGLERLLEPGAAYTILAPNDAAFGKLAPGEVDGLLEPAGHERLLTLLSHHILPGRLASGDLAGTVADHETLAGEALTIDATDVIRIGDAGMVVADLEADDSILHVIDRILPVTAP